jgi:hypothetical protein
MNGVVPITVKLVAAQIDLSDFAIGDYGREDLTGAEFVACLKRHEMDSLSLSDQETTKS